MPTRYFGHDFEFPPGSAWSKNERLKSPPGWLKGAGQHSCSALWRLLPSQMPSPQVSAVQQGLEKIAVGGLAPNVHRQYSATCRSQQNRSMDIAL